MTDILANITTKYNAGDDKKQTKPFHSVQQAIGAFRSDGESLLVTLQIIMHHLNLEFCSVEDAKYILISKKLADESDFEDFD